MSSRFTSSHSPLSNGLENGRRAIDRTVEQAADWWRDGSDRMRHQLSEASDRTVDYVRHQPVRSVLLFASAALLLFAAAQLLSNRDRH